MNNNYQYDVIIVGAGPAGSVLAYELAKKNVSVLVLEKNKMPYLKVCAGGITVRAASLLPSDITNIIEGEICGARLSYKKVFRKVRTYDKPIIYMVMRDKFDSFLAARAKEAGAVLVENAEVKYVENSEDIVKVITDTNTFVTPVLVGADGANSVVVRSLGLNKEFEYGLGINTDVKVKSDELKRWENLIGLDFGISGGYSWVFPKKTCLSIGSGSSLSSARVLKPYHLGLIRSYGLADIEGITLRGHLMPVRKAKAPLTRRRILLVGDAAGLIDPLTGEGIYYALRSAYLAVSPILNLLEGKSRDLVPYDESVNREFLEEFKIARTLRRMNSLAPRLFFCWLKDSDRFWRAFCRLLRGERTYASLKNRLSPPLQLFFR
jgi:geranylgeranyl reductase family protein